MYIYTTYIGLKILWEYLMPTKRKHFCLSKFQSSFKCTALSRKARALKQSINLNCGICAHILTYISTNDYINK